MSETIQQNFDVRGTLPPGLHERRREDSLAHTVLNATPLLVSYINRDFTYAYVNRAYTDWFGLSLGEMRGRRIVDVIGPAAFERMEKSLRAALEGERITYESWMPYGRAGDRYIHADLIPDRDSVSGAVRGVVAVVADISAQRRAEEEREAALAAMRETDADLRYLTTHVPCLIWSGIVTRGDDPNTHHWDIEPLSDYAAQTFFPLEITPGEGYLQAWYLNRLPEDQEKTNAICLNALASGAAEYASEFGCRGIEGSIHYFAERVFCETLTPGRLWHLVGVAVDISDRRRAEEKIRRQAEELSLLYESGRLIGQSLDIRRIYATFQSMVAQQMDTDGLLVSEYTAHDNKIRCTFAWIEGVAVDTSGFPVLDLAPEGSGLQSKVIREGEPLLINDYAAFESPQPERYYAGREGDISDQPEPGNSTQSLLLIPIKLDGRVLGVVQLQSYRRNAYTPEHLRLLESLSQQVAAASRNAFLYLQLERTARQQRAFLRDVLSSVTDGRLRLCDTHKDLPAPLPVAYGEDIALNDSGDLRVIRHAVRTAAQAVAFPEGVSRDLESGVGEAAMNAVVHGQFGHGRIYGSADGAVLQVWVTDRGEGIPVEDLPLATLQKGFTTSGTLGHGFKMILQTVSRIYLLTGPTGTTVVLEQDRVPQPNLQFGGI